MNISDKFFTVNGMKIVLDLQGLPENICREMKVIAESPFIRIALKVSYLDKLRKNYLTQLQEKAKSNHFASRHC